MKGSCIISSKDWRHFLFKVLLARQMFRAWFPASPSHPSHSISTRTSSPSTLSGNTSTRSCTGYSASPVFTWNAHECHGQITASPSIHPCPSGPCRWGQTLSSADNSPFTFARQIATPSTSNLSTCCMAPRPCCSAAARPAVWSTRSPSRPIWSSRRKYPAPSAPMIDTAARSTSTSR